MSLAIVISTAVWIGFFANRHVDYSHSLWWTFAFEADAPRMLRASLVVVLLAAAFLAMNLLRPARPEPGVASLEDLTRARGLIGSCSQAIANAALSGDKRLLFSAANDAFLMYQINGRSWVALGDPIGARDAQEELVWRFRELSDRHAGWTVFYQVSAERLPLYVDLGLAVMKLGEEARVSLADFSLEGSARAELRTQRRRAERDGATFEVLQPQQLPALLPKLQCGVGRLARGQGGGGEELLGRAHFRRSTSPTFRWPWCAVARSWWRLPACGSPAPAMRSRST